MVTIYQCCRKFQCIPTWSWVHSIFWETFSWKWLSRCSATTTEQLSSGRSQSYCLSTEESHTAFANSWLGPSGAWNYFNSGAGAPYDDAILMSTIEGKQQSLGCYYASHKEDEDQPVGFSWLVIITFTHFGVSELPSHVNSCSQLQL